MLTLAFLRGKASERRLRLFACACCRLVWNLVPSGPGRARVEAAERRADGLPPAEQAPAALAASNLTGLYAEVASIYCGDADPFVAALAVSVLADRADPRRAGRAAQAVLLDDLFGHPTGKLDARWRTPKVMRLAQSAYDRRRYDGLPGLADLLEAAGCDDSALLCYCRATTMHVRGCWALDWARGATDGWAS